MESLALVYDEDYVCPLPAGHRFPMPKFGLLRGVIEEAGLLEGGRVYKPLTGSAELACLAHDRAYVRAFCDGGLGVSAVKRIGLPWSPALVNRSLVAIGGTARTVELAMAHGLACNLAGGTHHAHADFGSGFCIFNDLAIAARYAQEALGAQRVLIIDLDVHQGDGTARIFQSDPSVFTFSMHCEKNFPLRKAQSDWDLPLAPGVGDEAYRGLVASSVRTLLDHVGPDLVLYDAGVDVHVDDRLGYLSLTDAGIAARDECVISLCQAAGVPVACVIGGGYDADHARLARRHAILHRVAHACWHRPSPVAGGGPPVSESRTGRCQ